MVGADAELPFSVRTLPDLAELVHRKLHLGAGGIAQIVKTKTRMPRRRAQESFVYGTASVHAELLMPPRVVLSAVLSEQVPVKLISFVAGSPRSVVCALNHGGRRGRRKTKMLCSTSVAIQVSGWTRPHIGDVIPPSAAPAAAPVCFMLRCRNGSSWWQGHFTAAQSRHQYVSGQESKQSFVDHAIVDAIPHNCAVRSSPTAVGCFAMQVHESSCTAGLLTKSRALVPFWGWIRPPVASGHAPPPAAFSLPPAAAPVCLFLQCRYRGCFRGVGSWHLVVDKQGGVQSFVDLAIADSVPYSSAVRSSPVATGSKLVCHASCVAVMLTNSRAIVRASGCIRPFLDSAQASPSAAASSLPPAAAPVCFFLRCRHRGCFTGVESSNLVVDKQGGLQSFLHLPHTQAACLQLISFVSGIVSHFGCTVLPYGLLVRFSFAAAGSTAKLLPDASCVAALLTGAIEQALGWIRPPLASAHAIPPDAASSVRPAAAPVCHASLCASQEPVFQEDFTNMTSGLLRFLTQTGAISRPGIEFLPRSFVSMFSFSAGTSSTKYVGDSSRAAALTNSRAIAQVSGCIHTFLACAWASPSSAASSLPPAAAPVCFFLQCRYGSSWWQGHFRAAQSRHQYVSGLESKQSLVDHAIVDAIPHKCAVRSSPTAVGCFAMQVHESSCTAGLLTKSRALVPVWGWIRPPVASAHAPPPAASSLPPAAAPVCLFLQCRYRGCFRGVESWHLVVDKQGGVQSFVDLAIADSVPYSSAVRSSPVATGSKLVCHASCVAVMLTNSRAIVRASGCIRPFLDSAQASPSAAASSLPPAAAPVCFFLQCRYGSSWWQGHFRAAQSRHQYVSGQESKQSLVDHAIVDAIPHKCAVRSSPTAVGCFAMQIHESSCTAGLLTKSRALVPVWGWIRPPVASAHAPPPAASSLPPAAAPVCLFLCRYRGCFRGVESSHLVVDKQGGMQSFVDLAIADSVPYSSAVRSSPVATGSKLVCHASCVAVMLANSRAIVRASGCIPRAAHHQRKHKGLEGLIGVHSGKLFVLVPSRYAHESSSKQVNHSVSCMRFPELVYGAGTAAWHCLRSVQAARKNYAVLRSSTCASRMWPPPVVAEPSPKKMGTPPPPSPTPSAACMLRVQGGARAAGSDFRPDVGLEAAVEVNCVEVSPLEETLRQAQVPFILMIRNLLPLLPSQALLQGRRVLLNLVLVGHSHGGVIAHSMAQCLESAGFLVKGILAADTLALPRKAEMPLPRFDPQALARHRSPYHWHLSSPKVNMMAPEVPWRIELM